MIMTELLKLYQDHEYLFNFKVWKKTHLDLEGNGL